MAATRREGSWTSASARSARCSCSPSPWSSRAPSSPGSSCPGWEGRPWWRSSRPASSATRPIELTDEPPAGNSVMLAANGELITQFYNENRAPVAADQIAEVMKQAMVAVEDARFYEHGGLDVQGTLRALVSNVAAGEVHGGRLDADPAAGQADAPAVGGHRRGARSPPPSRPWVARSGRRAWPWRSRTATARTSCSPGTSTSSTSGRTPTASSRRARLLRRGRLRADADAGRPAGRPRAEPDRRRPVHQPRGRDHPPQPGARPDGRAGLHHAGAGGGGRGRAAGPRARLRPRGAAACRRPWAPTSATSCRST